MEQELDQQPQLSPVDEMKRRVEGRQRALEDFRQQRAQLAAVEEAAVKNPTWYGETGKAVWGAGVDLVTETAIVAKDVARYILPVDKLILGFDGRADEASKQASSAIRGAADVIAPDNETLLGSGARGIMQFMVPYVGWAKAAGQAKGLASMTGRGFVIDATLFDPTQGNLSSLIKQLAPEHQNAALDFLATDPDDDEALNRLRNGLEGAVLGTALEGIFRMARWAIGKAKVDKAHADADTKSTDISDLKTPVDETGLRGAADELPEAADAKYFEVDEAKFDEINFDDKFAPQVDTLPPVVRAYHVSRAPAGTVLEARAPKDKGGQPEGLYFSLSKDDVAQYGPRGNNLREMEIDTRDFADITEVVGTREKGVPYSTAKKAAIEEARAAGKPGAVIRGDNFNTPELIVFDTKKITKGNAPETPAGAAQSADGATPQAPDGAPAGDARALTKRDLEADLRSSLNITPAQRAELNRLIMEGDDDAVGKMLQKDFNLDTINWSNIESADDIRKLITVTSNVLADHIDNVKGGVQTHAQTKRLANLVGLSGDQVHLLTKDLRGDKGIAARMYAAQRTMLAAAKEVFRLVEVSKAAPGDLAKKAAVLRQIELYAALQAEVKGAQTEIARALNGMAIIKQEAADGFKEFDQLMRSMDHGGKSSKSYERIMDDLLDAKSLEDLNAKIRTISGGKRVTNIIVEYTVNAMLSSPKTHLINFTSNVLNTFVYSGDRIIGGGVRRILFNDKVAWREAKLDMVRKFGSLGEAFKLARQAWRDGAPVSDKRQRLEFQTRKAISMDTNGLTGGKLWLAKTINVTGAVVRVPGRLLITGDEFFKTINRNAEVSVLAYRKADELAEAQGLKIGTDAYEKFVSKQMKELADPTNLTPAAREIRSKAVEKSRMVTFQESPKTGGGQKMESLINHNAYVKLIIAPFFRTPMNILRQSVIDRTILGLTIKETRDQVLRGNPREQAEAIARMTSGMAAMTGFWAFTGTDEKSPIQIIGKVPFDSSAKANGVLDYSIRFGDKWFQFNRLEPLGLWIGMIADARTQVDHSDDDERTFAFLQGALAGFVRNVVSKTWAQSVADLFDLMEGAMSGEPAAVNRAMAKFTSGEFGKLIPQVIKSVGRVALDDDERYAKEAWTFLDGLSAQLPVLNRDVPNRHDALGRPITWANSAASIVNPFAVSDNPSTPLDKELQRLSFTVRPMPKSLGGGLMDLSAAEYSKLTGLVGEIKMSRAGNLEATLNEVVQSEDYATWTDERKVFVMKKYIEKARGAARATLLLDTDMQQRFKDAKVTDLSALLSD